jgi:perosamine synthetase
MLKIPVAKPYLTKDEAQAAYDTVLSGWVTQGPRVSEFEDRFYSYIGAKFATATSSCTTALHLALIVAGVGKGDEVICPSLSFIATANSITYVGARPVFADIERGSYNIDPALVKKLITKKTKAILIVHQLGMPAEIDSFKAICKKEGLALIEDAACAVGSEYKLKKIGSHSPLVCFSFHPRKVLTTGDGGMVATSNKDLNTRLKLLRHHGMSVSDRERYSSQSVIFEEYEEIGFNYRMTDIQAAVGIEQLKKIEAIVKGRRKIAYLYHDAFRDIRGVELPLERKDCFSNYQSYALYLNKYSSVSRDRLIRELFAKGISTRRGVMTAHRELAYTRLYGKQKLPVSEDASDRSIILPLYFPMVKNETDSVINAVRKILK